MPKTNNDKRILDGFDKEFPSYQTQDIGEDFKLEAIRNFISKALQQAREEERKEWEDKIKKLPYGTNGNGEKWYMKEDIDNLIQDK